MMEKFLHQLSLSANLIIFRVWLVSLILSVVQDFFPSTVGLRDSTSANSWVELKVPSALSLFKATN